MIRSRVCDVIGIRHPIFQGGRAWVSDARLAAAVSNAGGLGIISAMNADEEYVRGQIRACRTMTDKPFGVNIMLMSPHVERVARLAAEMGHTLRQEPVFCTDSIYCEYAHMDFIKGFGVRLIEMETSSFYRMADLMEKPAIALMAVSDNSATGDSLLLRSEAQKAAYNRTRMQVIPHIILKIAQME